MATRKMQTGGKTKAVKTSPTRMATTAIAQAKKKKEASTGIVRWHGANTGVEFPSYMLDPDNHQPLPKYEKQISDSLQKRGISIKDYKKGGVVKKMQKGGTAHPGFKSVQAGIAAKQGVSKKAAGAILASAARKASPKAKAANPRLKRVKG